STGCFDDTPALHVGRYLVVLLQPAAECGRTPGAEGHHPVDSRLELERRTIFRRDPLPRRSWRKHEDDAEGRAAATRCPLLAKGTRRVDSCADCSIARCHDLHRKQPIMALIRLDVLLELRAQPFGVSTRGSKRREGLRTAFTGRSQNRPPDRLRHAID